MRKIIIPCLITSIIAFSPALQSDLTYRSNSETETSNSTGLTPSETGEQVSPEDAPSQDQETTTPMVPQEDTSNLPSPEASTLEDMPSDEEEEGTPVGQAASEGSRAAKKRQWRNIALAVGAVAVAVTALILVASNDGHHK